MIEELLREYGIDLPQYEIIYNIYDLKKVRLKYPVVVKVISKDIIHKSDVGGVITNIYTPEALERAINQIQRDVYTNKPHTLIEGFRVEEQVKGIEFFLGSKVDNAFGLVGAFGSGGIYVELYKDIVFFIPDEIKTKKDAVNILKRTKIGKEILEKEKIRGVEIGVDVLTNTILSFSKLLRDKHLTNLEINPLICNKNRCVACDIRKI